jgi:hypothetical protein
MRWVGLAGLVLALNACGGGIPLEEIAPDPIAFVRQEPARGLIGVDEFLRAARIPNPEDPRTHKAELTTTLCLIFPRTREIRAIPELGKGSLPLDWTPDGNRLLIGTREGQLFLLNLRLWNRWTGGFDRVQPKRSGGIAAIGNGPIRMVTIEMNANAAGRPQRALRLWLSGRAPVFIPGSEGGEDPDLSSDGRSVVFALRPRRASRDPIMYLTRLGEAPIPLGRGSQPRYSRDGKWIAFLRRRGAGGPMNVWIMRSDGSAKRRLTDTDFDADSPSVSPDGRHVVYASARGTIEKQIRSHLYVIRVSDRGEIQLTVNGQNGRPIW